jgi:hypothetical protein
MGHLKSLLIAVPVAVGLFAAPAAHAEWRGHGGGHGGGYGGGYGGGRGDWGRGGWHGHERHGGNNGAVVGAILGLGAAAVIGGLIASQPTYAPPPAVYAPPAPPYGYYQAAPVYAPPPGYYAAPQAYYAQPNYQ